MIPTHARPRPARRAPVALAAVATLLFAEGCTEPAPAVSVGEGRVRFAQADVLGLSDARRAELGDLAAFGLAVADGRVDEVMAPLLDARLQERRIAYAAAERMLDAAGVDDDQLRARYSLSPEYELTVRHLIVLSERWRPEAERAAARAKAEAALERIQAGEPFAEVAAQVSEEPGAEGRQGLLEPGREGAWVKEFWNAAVALDVGQISPVVETRYGFHVLRLENRAVVPFAEARGRVAYTTAGEMGDVEARAEAWVDSLAASRGGDRGAARTAALSVADSLGVVLPPTERAAAERELRDLAARWAAAFGFAEGMSAEQVRERALAAFRSSRQGATLARGELGVIAESLRRLYPVTIARSEGAG